MSIARSVGSTEPLRSGGAARPAAEREARRRCSIDNYDSFTYNLAHLFGELGAEVVVRRNDEITVEEAERLAPSHLVISPGPGRPEDAGVSEEMVRAFAGRVPTLGVCLGHQAIVSVFGGEVGAAHALVHGKATDVHHDGRGLFAGLPQDFPGRPLPLARCDVDPRLARGLGNRGRRRGDGRAPSRARGRRRSVPSGVGADAVRTRRSRGTSWRARDR